ncbi:MAG: dimethylsulfonioproprionate lyase family protein [Methylococcales bacterium]
MRIDESVLLQYALGTLNAAEVVSVDAALSESPEFLSQLYEIQETLTAMALSEAAPRPDPRLRKRILASIEARTRFEGFTERFAELFDLGKKEARRLLAKIDRTEAGEWTSTLFPGVNVLKFPGGPRVASATCGLISIKPNTIFPRHRHRDEERVMVLQGRARENSGRLFQPGDLLISEPGSEHAFVTLDLEPCVLAVLLRKDNQWLIFPSLLDRILGKNRFPDSGHSI